MANPKRRHTRARTAKRRASNWKVGEVSTCKCPNCSSLTHPHQVCSACGFYKDKVVVPQKEKKSKQEEKTEK